MCGIVDYGVVILGHHVRIIARRTHRPARSEDIALVQSVQTVSNHHSGELLLQYLVVSIGIEGDKLLVSSELEVHR